MPDVPRAVLRRDELEIDASGDPARDGVQPLYRLYSPAQVAGATFLGGPLGGAWLMATNFTRLRRPRPARWTMVAAAIATALVVLLAMRLPDGIPGGILWLPILFAMRGLAQAYQGAAFDEHIRQGGPRASSWHAAGWGAASMVVVAALVFGVAFGVVEATRPDSVAFGDSEVFYDRGASRADAERVGAGLQEVGLFDQPASVVVERRDHGLLVRFVVGKEGALDDGRMHAAFLELGRGLAADLGGPVFVELTDPELDRRVPVGWTDE